LPSFLQVWKRFTQDRYNCIMIKENQLTRFFRELGEIGDKETSLGFGHDYYDEGELKKHILKMGIKSDQGYVYFNELLYRCMRKKYCKFKLSKRMQIIELRNQYEIFQLTMRAQNRGTKLTNEQIYNNIVKKENGVNPFLTVMNFRVSFKTWVKHARKKLREFNKYRAQEYGDEEQYDTNVDNDNKQTYRVEIDIEIINEYTSDEDSQNEDSQSQSKIGTIQKGKSTMSIGSQSMRQRNLEKKKKDHLALFEKKMTQKFKKMSGAQSSVLAPTPDVTLGRSGKFGASGQNFAKSGKE